MELDINQNIASQSLAKGMVMQSIFSQNDALRRATLLKHRKVSTQFKLDMVERQLQNQSLESEAAFYRLQAEQLSNELSHLGCSLDEAERTAFKARHRLLTASSSTPEMPRSIKSKVRHLMTAPSSRLRRRHLMGDLRAVASLSSLSLKSNSPTGSEDEPPKEVSWRHPIRFLHSQIRRRIFATQRTHSMDNIHSSPKALSSDSEDSEEEENEKKWQKPQTKEAQTVDPTILAEIEDFEKMAANYIQNHSQH